MTMTRRVLVAGAGCVSLMPAAFAKPARIVSLNPCIDTVLVHLADHDRIAGLSHYARQAQSSTIADIAQKLPFTYETAEEIIGLSPDLVLASKHSGRSTRDALKRVGVSVETFAVPNSVAESLEMIRRVAAAIGQVERGDALVGRIEAAVETARPAVRRPPIKALVFEPRGLVAGKKTLVDEMMTLAGFENVAARYGVGSWGNVPLERVIADPPELLLAGEAASGAPSFAERFVAHPALQRIGKHMKRATFPEACLYCGGPVLLKTAGVLMDARDAFWSGQ